MSETGFRKATSAGFVLGGEEIGSAREKAHDKSFVGAAQLFAGRCILQCVHFDRRCPAAPRGRARASPGDNSRHGYDGSMR